MTQPEEDIKFFLSPLNYEKMLDTSVDELRFMADRCEQTTQNLKKNILAEYEIIKPSLSKMRMWKQQITELRERAEIYRTFLSIGNNGTLGTDSFLGTLLDNKKENKHVTLSDVFKDIEARDTKETKETRDFKDPKETPNIIAVKPIQKKRSKSVPKTGIPIRRK